MNNMTALIGVLVAVLLVIVMGTGCGTEQVPLVPATDAAIGATQPAGPVDGLAATSTPGAIAATLGEDYPDALAARNQLALGSLRLEGTANAITPEQAAELMLFWQALVALTDASTSAAEETAAVQTQIIESMTAAQIEAIAAMALTDEDLSAFYVEQGVALTTPEPGVTPQGGKNSGLSQESREATRTAAEALGTPVGTGGGTGSERRDLLLDALIALLDQRAGE